MLRILLAEWTCRSCSWVNSNTGPCGNCKTRRGEVRNVARILDSQVKKLGAGKAFTKNKEGHLTSVRTHADGLPWG